MAISRIDLYTFSCYYLLCFLILSCIIVSLSSIWYHLSSQPPSFPFSPRSPPFLSHPKGWGVTLPHMLSVIIMCYQMCRGYGRAKPKGAIMSPAVIFGVFTFPHILVYYENENIYSVYLILHRSPFDPGSHGWPWGCIPPSDLPSGQVCVPRDPRRKISRLHPIESQLVFLTKRFEIVLLSDKVGDKWSTCALSSSPCRVTEPHPHRSYHQRMRRIKIWKLLLLFQISKSLT